MKNYLYANILSVACPTCKAVVGQRCTLNLNEKCHNFAHPERLKIRPTGRVFPLPGREPAFKCGGAPSAACKRGCHKICSGRTARNHGMFLTCSCMCHKQKKQMEVLND